MILYFKKKRCILKCSTYLLEKILKIFKNFSSHYSVIPKGSYIKLYRVQNSTTFYLMVTIDCLESDLGCTYANRWFKLFEGRKPRVRACRILATISCLINHLSKWIVDKVNAFSYKNAIIFLIFDFTFLITQVACGWEYYLCPRKFILMPKYACV